MIHLNMASEINRLFTQKVEAFCIKLLIFTDAKIYSCRNYVVGVKTRYGLDGLGLEP